MFQSLKGNGRVWIYTAKRPLTIEEAREISATLKQFCSGWAAHGARLLADFEIKYNQVLVLAVDEEFEGASGCSIDKATDVFRQLDQRFNLDLFNRFNLCFIKDDVLQIVKLQDISQAYKAGIINDQSVMLDNTISTLAQLRSNWMVQLESSWAYSRIIRNVAQV